MSPGTKTEKLEKLTIANRSYSKVSEQPLFITTALRQQLEKRKFRDGSTAYAGLTTRGFRGGKHVLELIAEKLGKTTRVVLSRDKSSISKGSVVINFDDYRDNGGSLFFEMYRGTGLKAASSFLSKNFPDTFPPETEEPMPAKKTVRRVLESLPEATATLSKKDQAKVPGQIAGLVSKQGPEFVLDVLTALDDGLQGASFRLKGAFTDVITRLAKEPAAAMSDLADLMDRWTLVQVTSLLNVLRTRLDAIETFEQIIHDDKTYELKEDNSIHRTLERSMWLLNDSYWIAQSNKSLRTFIGKELSKKDKEYEKRRPDFACVNAMGRTVLVEIKRPAIELKKSEVDQAELYIRLVKKYKADAKKPEIFLIGNKISDEARELADLRSYPTLQTYQDLIDSSRQRYQEYLRVAENG